MARTLGGPLRLSPVELGLLPLPLRRLPPEPWAIRLAGRVCPGAHWEAPTAPAARWPTSRQLFSDWHALISQSTIASLFAAHAMKAERHALRSFTRSRLVTIFRYSASTHFTSICSGGISTIRSVRIIREQPSNIRVNRSIEISARSFIGGLQQFDVSFEF